MRNILVVSHRFPYPPNRGEKIRLWHLIKHLARSNRIFLGCLIDDKRDWDFRPQVEAVCAELGGFAIDKRRRKIAALAGMRPGRPLMLDFYANRPLREWIADLAARERIDIVYAYSTAMAPYTATVHAPRRVLDMVDVDSEKWADYARAARWPARLIWAREARTLLAYERQAAMANDCALLVTQAECDRFAQLAPETSGHVVPLENGVDLDFFAPAAPLGASPYPDQGPWLTLVGNMDYWPNVDAATWFAQHVLPILRRHAPAPRLAIVGANPGREVLRLAALAGVLVTGRVEDVRPYLAHAAVVIAPLRIARGVQNKVLEGMAMGRPVVASPQAFEGIRAQPGRDLLVASGADATARAIAEILDGHHTQLGDAGRAAVERGYSWRSQLARLDRLLVPSKTLMHV